MMKSHPPPRRFVLMFAVSLHTVTEMVLIDRQLIQAKMMPILRRSRGEWSTRYVLRTVNSRSTIKAAIFA